MMTRGRWTMALAVAGALACGSEEQLADGPPIVGGAVTTFVTDSGELRRPRDLSTVPISAVSLDENGEFVTRVGAGHPDGTFEIPDVPDGTYYVRVGTTFILTSSRWVDFSAPALGRSDGVKATIKTPMELDVTELAPWTETDVLQMFSSNAGAYCFSPEWDALVPPMAGATALVDFEFDYRLNCGRAQSDGVSLIEAAKGDRLVVTQLATKMTAGGVPYQAIVKAFSPAPFTMTDGVKTNLTGAFVDVPQTGRLAITEWKHAKSDAQRVQTNPAAKNLGDFIGIQPEPTGRGIGCSNAPDLVVMQSTEIVDSTPGDISFGNPYPPAWSVSAIAGGFYAVEVRLDSATPTQLSTGWRVARKVGEMPPVIEPLLGPPQLPLVNGADAFTAKTGITTTPKLTWGPPSLGQPTSYSVYVVRIYADERMRTRQTRLATLRTSQTNLQIPPGLLRAGESYAFIINSHRNPSEIDLTITPFHCVSSYDNGGGVITAVFQP